MSIEGHATAEGTARYRGRFHGTVAEGHFRFACDLWLSSIGIGTYLGEWDEATDRAYAGAAEIAVESGANVIDTAANYRFQRSERAIGEALANLTRSAFGRDELLICTKGGYLPFDNAPPADVRRYVEETFVATGIAEFSDIVAGSHCMTPAYLQSQLDQSRRNMNLDCIDVYYLHNPETQLSTVSRPEFERRLAAAFAQLEAARAAGQIRMYGAATWNGFRAAPDAREYLSLERLIALAHDAGGADHGFRFIQLPFNLAMPEALLLDNQTLRGARVSLLEAARAHAITVVASASILQGRVIARALSAAVREPLGALATDAQTAIQFVRSTPGITTALVGMKQRAHVEENLQLARVPPSPPEDYRQLFSPGE